MSTAQDFSFVDHFLKKIENVTTVKGLHQELETATYDLGFTYFALIQHVHPKGWPHPIIHLHNYPKGWVDAYDEQHLFLDDPVLQACRNSNIGFAWEDLAVFCNPSAEHSKILTISADAGLGTGYTVPANIPGELPGSCSFVSKLDQKLPRHNLLAAQLIGAFAYGAAREVIGIDKLNNPERVGLTPRQHDCLMLAMRGKTDGEIGETLGISEETVTKHLNLARAKFGVSKRLPLALKAIYMGLINLDDVFEQKFILKG